MMVVPVVAGNIFFLLFRQEGPINSILEMVISQPVDIQWLTSFPTALVPIIAADVWKWTPLLFLIMYAGLSNLPEGQVDAARAMGATKLQIFKHITLPVLMPVILIGLVIRLMGALRVFDLVWILTGGGPGTSTEVISIYLFRNTFEFFRIGYTSAASLLVFIVAVTVFTIALRPLLGAGTRTFEED